MSSFTLHGIPVSRGIAIGRAHILSPAALDVQHYLIAPDNIEAEGARLHAALSTVRAELDELWGELPQDSPPELGAFIHVHMLILSDPMLSEVPLDIIRTRRYNAEWALATQIEALCAQFTEIEDTYLRERRADIEQVGERILKALTGSASLAGMQHAAAQDTNEMIVVAHDISPADMLHFRNRAFCGFVTDLGGQNSHTAIVARSLDIPAVVGVADASSFIKQNDLIIVDGDTGTVVVRPTEAALLPYRERQMQLVREHKKLGKLKKMPAVTLDGTDISLLANVEFPDDCPQALDGGANGVGLLRSEYLFMNRPAQSAWPSEEEQFTFYRQAVAAMKGRFVTIRTLDVGSDKPLGEVEHAAANPALGLRAIRFCLAQPEMFLAQLRAILRTSALGPVRLLLPMLSHAFEIDQTLAWIAQAKSQLRDKQQPFDEHIQVGAMIEVPAAALALPMFIKRLDFLSIGTNDLIQYTLAIDRADHEVAHLYDPLHPAVLSLLSNIIRTATKAGVPVAVCGEMAGDVHMTRLLLGLGLREFSMHPAQLLSVKNEIIHSDLRVIEPLVRKILRIREPQGIARTMAALRAS